LQVEQMGRGKFFGEIAFIAQVRGRVPSRRKAGLKAGVRWA
jgi:hypothetical protein